MSSNNNPSNQGGSQGAASPSQESSKPSNAGTPETAGQRTTQNDSGMGKGGAQSDKQTSGQGQPGSRSGENNLNGADSEGSDASQSGGSAKASGSR